MRKTFGRGVTAVALMVPVMLASAKAADVLSQLGLTPKAAQEAVAIVVRSGVSNPGLPSQTFKAMPPAARAQAATAGVAWLKSYVNSPEFTRGYLASRDQAKPQPPEWERTPEQELQKTDDDQKQQLADSKQVIASLPPGQRKAMEDALKATADMLATMNTPEQRKMRLDAIKMSRAAEMKEHDEAVARWKLDYPDNPKPIVVKRLKEFLQLSADVDFGATLHTSGGSSTFVNPAYQSKSSQWKMCYRAGREATAAARAAAQAWLTELGG